VNESEQSIIRHIAKRVREVEDALPTSCTWESSHLNEIAGDLEGLADTQPAEHE
jgi:hypothetical protein